MTAADWAVEEDIRCKQCDTPHDRWDLEYCPACVEGMCGSTDSKRTGTMATAEMTEIEYLHLDCAGCGWRLAVEARYLGRCEWELVNEQDDQEECPECGHALCLLDLN